jgi:chaperonin GroES
MATAKPQLDIGTPLYDRIVIERIEREPLTPGGLVIPDNAKEKPHEGRVLAVGCGRVLADGELRPLILKVGDRVMFGKYSGAEVQIAGKEVVIMREEEIMLKF